MNKLFFHLSLFVSLFVFPLASYSNSLVPTAAEYMNNHAFIQSGKYPVPSSGNFIGYFYYISSDSAHKFSSPYSALSSFIAKVNSSSSEYYYSRFGGCDYNFLSINDFMTGSRYRQVSCDNGMSKRSNNEFWLFSNSSISIERCEGFHLSEPYCSSSVPFCELDSTKESMKQMESECERNTPDGYQNVSKPAQCDSEQESIVFKCSYEPVAVDWCSLPETKSKIDSFLKSCADGVPQGSVIKTNKVDCNPLNNTLNPVCEYEESIGPNPNPDPDKPNYDVIISHMDTLHKETQESFDLVKTQLNNNASAIQDGFSSNSEEHAETQSVLYDLRNKQDLVIENLTDKNNPDSLVNSISSLKSLSQTTLKKTEQIQSDMNNGFNSLNSKLDNLNPDYSGSVGNPVISSTCLTNLSTCDSYYDVSYSGNLSDVIKTELLKIRDSIVSGIEDNFSFNGSGSGEIPVWSIDLSSIKILNLGVYDISISPYIWGFLRACLLFTAAVSCRKIIFGG